MGNSISVLLTNIFMDKLKCKILNSIKSDDIIFLDDILPSFTGSDRQLKQFLNCKNNVHRNIKLFM